MGLIGYMWLSCCFLYGSVYCLMINQAADTGRTVLFNCYTSEAEQYYWYMQYDNYRLLGIDTNSTQPLYVNGSFLSIEPLMYGYGTYYMCEWETIVVDNITVASNSSAAVIAVGHELACSLSTNQIQAGDTLEVTCYVSTSGPATPNVTCHQSTNDGTLQEINSQLATDVVTTNNTYLSTTYEYKITNTNFTFQFVADSGVPNANIECLLQFDEPPSRWQGVNTADNVPDYTSTWTSSTIDIYYPPQNLTIHPANDTLHVGVLVSCYANANPAASFVWSVLPDAEPIGDGALFGTSMKVFGMNSYLCEATNTIQGTDYKSYINTNITVIVDWCQASPCQYGDCVYSNLLYTCVCNDGYTGDHCEVEDIKDYKTQFIIFASLFVAAFVVLVGFAIMLWKRQSAPAKEINDDSNLRPRNPYSNQPFDDMGTPPTSHVPPTASAATGDEASRNTPADHPQHVNPVNEHYEPFDISQIPPTNDVEIIYDNGQGNGDSNIIYYDPHQGQDESPRVYGNVPSSGQVYGNVPSSGQLYGNVTADVEQRWTST